MNRIAILGPGSIGQLLCWQLRHHKPVLLGRSPAPDALVHTDIKDVHHSFTPEYRPLDKARLDDIGLLIVTVKAYQVLDAITPLLQDLPADCAILLMHNGMGPHLELAQLLNGRSLLLGTTSQGALKQGLWHIRHTGKGLTQIGLLCGDADSGKTRVEPLLDKIENSEWVDDILAALWQKLAVNAAINPLTAIHDCRNGALAADEYRELIHAIVAELVKAAAADSIVLDETTLLERVYKVIALTANNFSSMHQDIAHGRQTEIDAINGFVVKRAQANGLEALANLSILEQVKSLQPRR